ncbi:MAG: arsenate reductase ArsC [Phycisphaerae bacterium]
MPEKPKPKVLFLCTGNACRSQMAEGWARHLRGDRLEPFSAGTSPHGLDPRAVRVMAEEGVDISGQRSKHVDEVCRIPFDYVVTVCDRARDACPVFPGKARALHAGFEDPAAAQGTEEEVLAVFRRVRDEIRQFIERLPETLSATTLRS